MKTKYFCYKSEDSNHRFKTLENHRSHGRQPFVSKIKLVGNTRGQIQIGYYFHFRVLYRNGDDCYIFSFFQLDFFFDFPASLKLSRRFQVNKFIVIFKLTIAQKMKLSIKDFFSKSVHIRITEEILNGKVHFLCSVRLNMANSILIFKLSFRLLMTQKI